MTLVKNNILGIEVNTDSNESILEYIDHSLQKKGEKYYIVTPNPEMVVYARKHPDFQKILNQARIAICDGVGLGLAGIYLGSNVKERITGTDLMISLCKKYARKPVTVGFLGAGPKVAEKTAECLREKCPGLQISFIGSEWPDGKLNSKSEYIVSSIQYIGKKEKILNTEYSIPHTDILFIAFGFPKQEEWMSKNLPHIPVKIAMGVGGAFDYISGSVSRAPYLIRALGFEWLYRLIKQPWRWKRQLALIEFIWLVLKEKTKKNPPL